MEIDNYELTDLEVCSRILLDEDSGKHATTFQTAAFKGFNPCSFQTRVRGVQERIAHYFFMKRWSFSWRLSKWIKGL